MASARQQGGDRGAVAILVAVGVVAMMLLVGLVVDFGQVFAARARLQNAVDSASLAGAQEFCLGLSDREQESAAVASAAKYAELNRHAPLSLDQAESGRVSYVRVSASEPVTLFFGALADDTDSFGNAAVGASAAASRECFINFQFVATETVQFNGGRSSGGNWYAGECFDGQNNSFDTVAVGEPKDHQCADPNVNGDPPPIVRAEAPVKLFAPQVPKISATQAMLSTPMGAYVEGGSADPWATVTKTACRDVVWSASTTPIVCEGSLDGLAKVPPMSVVADVIMASGNIDMSNSVDFRGRLVYSRTGNITLLNGVPAGTIVYAPEGSVTFNGSGTRNLGMIFARNIVFNGGDQVSGQGVDLYAPGPIALVR